MDANKEEALKAKEIANKRFCERNFAGAKTYALKAKSLYPGLDGISQMVSTFEVYAASEVKCNGETDYYSILGLKPSADREAVKKQYRKLAVLLHPDKNKCVGADGAFKLVSEAWTFLSDRIKKSSHDIKRNKQMPTGVVQTSTYAAGVTCVNATTQSRLDTFWTVCTSCKVQYEYLRKYVNKRLSCKNCRGTFVAVETGSAPLNGSFPYSPWSYVPSNGYGSHGNGVTYVPTNATFFSGNGVSSHHSGHGHGYEYVPNMTFQWSSFSGTSTGVVSHNGVSAISADAIYQSNEDARVAGSKVKSGANGKASKSFATQSTTNLFNGYNESLGSKSGNFEKKRKVIIDSEYRNGFEDKGFKSSEAGLANGNRYEPDPKLSNPSEPPNRRSLLTPVFDARKLLIDKARTEIRKKLEEIKLASEAAAAASVVKSGAKEDGQSLSAGKAFNGTNLSVSANQSASNKGAAVSITVPDSDFHDFDKDRSEECFKPKQIWALYDEDDGMPRLYCLIRQVISEKPFKIHITYLNSKSDNEFGSVNWLDSGFTKSCGHFRAWSSDIVDQVNIFSHLLRGQKAGRGGCIRIFPKRGDVWAVYRNWSPDWNRSTPAVVRHQYEMVEVLEDYNEELGVWVTPLIKSIGFKTVYHRNIDKDAVRWIPRKEMFRFSHLVPAWLLEGESEDLPDRCWDLDPAATPDELLHAASEGKASDKQSFWNQA